MPDSKGRPGLLGPKKGDTVAERFTPRTDREPDGLFDDYLEEDEEEGSR